MAISMRLDKTEIYHNVDKIIECRRLKLVN